MFPVEQRSSNLNRLTIRNRIHLKSCLLITMFLSLFSYLILFHLLPGKQVMDADIWNDFLATTSDQTVRNNHTNNPL